MIKKKYNFQLIFHCEKGKFLYLYDFDTIKIIVIKETQNETENPVTLKMKNKKKTFGSQSTGFYDLKFTTWFKLPSNKISQTKNFHFRVCVFLSKIKKKVYFLKDVPFRITNGYGA